VIAHTPELLALLLGLALGSFGNVLIHRVPLGQSLLRPGSHCPGCARPIRAWENIPLLSWVLLRGRCAGCGMAISVRYPLVEALVAGLFVLLALRWPLEGAMFHYMPFVLLLVVLAFVDWDTFRLPNPLVLALALSGALSTLAAALFLPDARDILDPAGAGLGLLAGFGSLYAVRQLSRWWLKGQEGLGFGDVKLMGAAGVYLGWERTLLAIFLACVAGLLLALPVQRLKGSREIPFGPWLALGCLLALFIGDRILAWYIASVIGSPAP
jgi:leader peptidase (prepilin peptidase)/N-methyltransferase